MSTITLAATSLPAATAFELLEAAEEAGFDGVGLRIGPLPSENLPYPPLLSTPGIVADIERRIAQSRLIVFDIYSLYLTPSFDFESCRATLELGAQFGARYVVVVGRDTECARACDTLGRICELASPLGLTVMLEFAPHRWPATLEEALRWIQAVNRTNLAVLPDPAHLFGSRGQLADLRGIDPKFLRYSQYCDIRPGAGSAMAGAGGPAPVVERCLPGDGELPLAAWLDALPRGLPISVECPPPPANEMSHTAWARTLAKRIRDASAVSDRERTSSTPSPQR